MTPDLTILRHLGTRTHASAAEIGTACRMAPGEVRARLVMLERFNWLWRSYCRGL